MKIAVLKESAAGETRVAATPETVKKFTALGAAMAVESGAGDHAGFSDDAYREAGAEIGSRADVAKCAQLVLGIQAPDPDALAGVEPGAQVAALFDPFRDAARVQAYADAGLEALSMEFMPRITRAQSMDVLSSQSNLAGYKAVMAAAN
jgi:NAD(P) transhydrogenase subunit alpha